MVRRRIDPPPGWRKLDAFHSPAETNRFVRPADGDYYHVIDLGSYGATETWYVQESVERGIFEESPDGSRPYTHTDVRSQTAHAKDVSEDRAYSIAMGLMSGGGTDPEFDMFGGGP